MKYICLFISLSLFSTTHGQNLPTVYEEIQLEGIYECHVYDTGGKNEWHYVKIVKNQDEFSYTWENRAGVSWQLTPTNSPFIFEVSESCPYYDLYKTAKVIVDDSKGIIGVWGPYNEFYSFEEKLEVAVITNLQQSVAYKTLFNHGDRVFKTSPVYWNDNEVQIIQVSQGEKISVTGRWRSDYISGHCPGCIQQFYIGIKDEFIQCIYNGSSNMNLSQEFTIHFEAPSTKGAYLLQADSSLDYYCKKQASGLTGKKEHSILCIVVI